MTHIPKVKSLLTKYYAHYVLYLAIFIVVIGFAFFRTIVDTVGMNSALWGDTPSITQVEDLQDQHGASFRKVVTFTTNKLYDTKYMLFKSGSITSSYSSYAGTEADIVSRFALAPLNHDYVIIEVAPDFWEHYDSTKPYTFNGYVKKLRPDPIILTTEIEDLPGDAVTISSLIAPLSIQTDYRGSYVSGAVVQVILFILIIALFIFLLFTLVPKYSPVGKIIKRYGNYNDVVEQIDDEINHQLKYAVGNLIATKSWLLCYSKSNLIFVKIEDITAIAPAVQTVRIVQAMKTVHTHYVEVQTPFFKKKFGELKTSNEAQKMVSYLLEQAPQSQVHGQ